MNTYLIVANDDTRLVPAHIVSFTKIPGAYVSDETVLVTMVNGKSYYIEFSLEEFSLFMRGESTKVIEAMRTNRLSPQDKTQAFDRKTPTPQDTKAGKTRYEGPS